MNDGTWKCIDCGTTAEVKGRKITVYPPPSLYPHWPLHYDCPLASDIDHINFSKLVKVG